MNLQKNSYIIIHAIAKLMLDILFLSIDDKSVLHQHRARMNDNWIHTKWRGYLQTNLKISRHKIQQLNLWPITQYMKAHRFSTGRIIKLMHDQN